MRPLSALWLALAVALPLACGGDERTVETEEGSVTVTEEDEGVRMEATGREGERIESRFGGDVEIEDFPDDLPLYPGARATASVSAEGKGDMVTLETGDGPSEIFEFYREQLRDQGWKIEGETTFGGQHMLAAAKQDRRASVVITGSEGEASQIMLTVGFEEE